MRVSETSVLIRAGLAFVGKGGWITVRMGKKNRRVPLNERAAEVLREFLEAEAGAGESAPLFSSRLKKPNLEG